MNRTTFEDYLRRFNAEDASAFDDYLAPDMHMVNGTLEFHGVAGMRDHYEHKIWPYFRETLHLLNFVSDDRLVAVQLWTNFRARTDAVTLFGPVVTGEQFDYRGLILYELQNHRFRKITVAYNSFRNTKPSGVVVDLGMPH